MSGLRSGESLRGSQGAVTVSRSHEEPGIEGDGVKRRTCAHIRLLAQDGLKRESLVGRYEQFLLPPFRSLAYHHPGSQQLSCRRNVPPIRRPLDKAFARELLAEAGPDRSDRVYGCIPPNGGGMRGHYLLSSICASPLPNPLPDAGGDSGRSRLDGSHLRRRGLLRVQREMGVPRRRLDRAVTEQRKARPSCAW